MKLDILAIGVHPDDVELSCSGTLLKHIDLGYKVGVVDLTAGEMGSRGSGKIRLAEAEASAKFMGLSSRVNLGLKDVWFENDRESKLRMIEQIRYFKPDIVLSNAVSDRHPDHGRASKLISEACYYSGLLKIETSIDGVMQDKWRPRAVYNYIQDRELKPDFVVDISEFFSKKIEAIKCYKSQFYDPNSTEPRTPISSESFLKTIEAKSRIYARDIMVDHAEAYTVERAIGIEDITMML